MNRLSGLLVVLMLLVLMVTGCVALQEKLEDWFGTPEKVKATGKAITELPDLVPPGIPVPTPIRAAVVVLGALVGFVGSGWGAYSEWRKRVHASRGAKAVDAAKTLIRTAQELRTILKSEEVEKLLALLKDKQRIDGTWGTIKALRTEMGL